MVQDGRAWLRCNRPVAAAVLSAPSFLPCIGVPSLIGSQQPICADLHTLVLQRLPGLLAATGMLLLLVMSIVALWPPGNGAHITPRVQSTLNEASFPRKVFNM